MITIRRQRKTAPRRRFAIVSIALRSTALVVAAATLSIGACKTETPTHVVVENAFPLSPDPPHATIVYRVWWSPTYFSDPVVPGASSPEELTVPATDFAYALVAPGWDPASGAPPTTLVPLKSKEKLTVRRGDTLHITMSNDTFTGSCDTQPLSQEDADLITQRIFVADFAGYKYDAKTCALLPLLDGSEPAMEEPAVDASSSLDAGAGAAADGSLDAAAADAADARD